MTRSLISVSAGLIAVVGLALGSSVVDAGHHSGRYQNNCCQPVNSCGCEQAGYANYQTSGSYRHSRRSYYGQTTYGYGGQRHNGYYGYQQTASCAPANSYVTPATYSAPVTTACCAPQATCCGGESVSASAVTPASYSTSQAPADAPPAPIPGH
jgi:hypothetical protein